MTEQASEELTQLFAYHIPQRWSIAHLYQAILNKEEHVKDIDFMTTLEGYVHWKLTGEKVLGVGEASGMFPVDMNIRNYDKKRMEQFDELTAPYHFPWKLEDILPKVLLAGEEAGETDRGRCEIAGYYRRAGSRRTALSAGRRCRNRYGGNQQCGAAYGKCVCRNFCVCHGGSGKRAV